MSTVSRKWWLILALTSVLFALFLWSNRSTPITNHPSSGTSIVAFGDSLVSGVGSTDGGFVRKLSQLWGEPIINMGVPGDTTASALLRVSEIQTHNPKIVIVLLGGNDYLRRIPRSETEQNLRTIIETVHGYGAVVVLLGVRGGLLTDSSAELYENLAEEYGTLYVSDVLKGLFGKKEFMADEIHPNDKGYQEIAQRVFEAMKPLRD